MKIKKKTIQFFGLFLITLSFFKPGILENYPFYNTLYNYWTLLSSISIIIYYILKKKISNLQFLILLQIALYGISTLLNSRDFYTLIANFVPLLAICMLSEIQVKKNCKRYLRCLSIIIFLEIFINFIFICLYPTGVYGEGIYGSYKYFLGYDNYSALFINLGMIIIILFNYISKGKLTLLGIATMIIVLISYIITWAVTPMISALIASILVILVLNFHINKIRWINKLINFKTVFFASIVFFIAIVIFRIQDNFSYLIVDILHKDLTFTGRTLIWDRSLEQFLSSPWIGIGITDYNVRLATLNIYHAHCTLLNILMEGGIFVLIIYTSMLYYANKKMSKIKNTTLYWILLIGFISYFIITSFDVLKISHTFYILLALTINSPQIQEMISNEKNSRIDNNN